MNDDIKVNRLGNLYGYTGGSYAYMVYDPNGLAPTLNCMGGGGREPMIVETIEENNINIAEPISTNGTSISGCIRATYYKNGERNIAKNVESGMGYEGIVEPCIVASRGRNPENPSDRTTGFPTEQRLEMNTTGTTNCITSVAKDNWLLEPKIEKVDQISSDGSQYGTVISENGVATTIAAGTHGYANSCIQIKYRIRKLTPKETWRLQGFYDSDFRQAEKLNSNTALYKQSGNAIARNVVVAIFGQMFEGKENIYKQFTVTDLKTAK